MPRPKDQNWAINPVYSYISFLEMAGYVSSSLNSSSVLLLLDKDFCFWLVLLS